MTSRSIRWYDRLALAALLVLLGFLAGLNLKAEPEAPAVPPPAPTQVLNPAPTYAALPAATAVLASVPLETIPDVAAAVLPSVVNLRIGRMGGGSGVIVDGAGIVLTNHHVVASGGEVVVALHDGREYEGEVVGSDAKTDLAVVRLKGDVPDSLVPIRIGDSDALRIGETVLAVGNPFGLSGTVTLGIVSALGRANRGIVDYEDFIQTDAAINPGNSGGALVNTRGELVGINTAILSGTGGSQGVGFSIPTDLARPIMQSLLDNGRVDRGWLGVYIRDATPAAYDFQKLRLPEDLRGVFVDGFAEGSPAAVAGLRKGDVIIQVDGRATSTSSRLRNTVAHMPAGHTVDLDLMRMGKRMTVSVPLDPLPDEVPERGSRSRR
ncbi:MAG: trypsin-like serine protease [Proteobacteria bacterium]|nr:trypsin-like serine protease [Pseudomonadota bacterium]